MKKFSFSLERVLEWREIRANQERNELEKLNRTLAELESRKEHVARAVTATSKGMAEGSPMSGGDLRTVAAFLSSLHASAAQLRKLSAQCQSAIQAQRHRCIAADRDVRLLSRLKERRLSAWHYEYNRHTEQAAEEAWQAGQARERLTNIAEQSAALR